MATTRIDRHSWTDTLRDHLVTSARAYRDSLLSHEYLFLYGPRNRVTSLEVKFPDSRWAHLAGVTPYPGVAARTLFARCCDGSVTAEDIVFPTGEGLEGKAEVFPALVGIGRNATNVSTFNGRARALYTEMLVSAPRRQLCLGLVHESESSRTYVPNSLMQRDRAQIERISEEAERLMPVRAAFSKQPGERDYTLCEQLRGDLTHTEKAAIGAIVRSMVDMERVERTRPGTLEQLGLEDELGGAGEFDLAAEMASVRDAVRGGPMWQDAMRAVPKMRKGGDAR